MKNSFNWFVPSLSIFMTLFFINSSSFSSEINLFPTLKMNGEIYENSCSANKKEVLKGEINPSRLKNADQVWSIIVTILCKPANEKNIEFLKLLTLKKIREATASTGARPQRELVTPSRMLVRDVMAECQAWDADIQVESGKVILQYFANEACVRSVKMRFAKSKWIIYEVGEACD